MTAADPSLIRIHRGLYCISKEDTKEDLGLDFPNCSTLGLDHSGSSLLLVKMVGWQSCRLTRWFIPTLWLLPEEGGRGGEDSGELGPTFLIVLSSLLSRRRGDGEDHSTHTPQAVTGQLVLLRQMGLCVVYGPGGMAYYWRYIPPPLLPPHRADRRGG